SSRVMRPFEGVEETGTLGWSRPLETGSCQPLDDGLATKTERASNLGNGQPLTIPAVADPGERLVVEHDRPLHGQGGAGRPAAQSRLLGAGGHAPRLRYKTSQPQPVDIAHKKSNLEWARRCGRTRHGDCLGGVPRVAEVALVLGFAEPTRLARSLAGSSATEP